MTSHDELTKLYDELESLRAIGKEDEARELLISNLAKLPEGLRGRIMLQMFTADTHPVIAVDTEATADGGVLYIQLSWGAGHGWVIDAHDLASDPWLVDELCNRRTLIFHNASYDLQQLWKLGMYPARFHDTMIMAWMLQDHALGLKDLARQL